ncbi:MAG: cobalamin-binding protein [Deltaproteobacteria bacterium]|nr:cobalamin-binding protein [Deltaproteobacteria bacterium]MBW2415439.1 cobalamin-binding protein [Deltaproteobacteria bacterium]
MRDARGREHRLAGPPLRIVSLVPSHTETLFALGLGERVVGITDYCVHPASGVRGLPRVGGTKNPSIERIAELSPDLVLANREENTRRDVQRLEALGLRVFVTYARTVREGVDDISLLAGIGGCPEAAAPIVEEIDAAWQRARERRPEAPPRVAALVWKRPYMAVGPDTFAHDLIRECGGHNVFGEGERRYPRVDEDALVAAAPDLVLLPTEPYEFGPRDRDELLALDLPAAAAGRVCVIEGELLSWYGPRIARALDLLSELIRG